MPAAFVNVEFVNVEIEIQRRKISAAFVLSPRGRILPARQYGGRKTKDFRNITMPKCSRETVVN